MQLEHLELIVSDRQRACPIHREPFASASFEHSDTMPCPETDTSHLFWRLHNTVEHNSDANFDITDACLKLANYSAACTSYDASLPAVLLTEQDLPADMSSSTSMPITNNPEQLLSPTCCPSHSQPADSFPHPVLHSTSSITLACTFAHCHSGTDTVSAAATPLLHHLYQLWYPARRGGKGPETRQKGSQSQA